MIDVWIPISVPENNHIRSVIIHQILLKESKSLFIGFINDKIILFYSQLYRSLQQITYLEDHNEISNWNSDLSLKNFINQYGIPKIDQIENGVEFTNHYTSNINSKRIKSVFESIIQS